MELDNVAFKVDMRTAYLSASAEKLVEKESGKAEEEEIPTGNLRRASIVSGKDKHLNLMFFISQACAHYYQYIPNQACSGSPDHSIQNS